MAYDSWASKFYETAWGPSQDVGGPPHTPPKPKHNIHQNSLRLAYMGLGWLMQLMCKAYKAYVWLIKIRGGEFDKHSASSL